VPYFAAALVRTADGWAGHELDLDEVGDIDGVADLLRDLVEGGAGPALMFLEEDDEYFLVVRVDAAVDEARSFISDVRAVETSELAARLYDESSADPVLSVDEGAAPAEDEEDTARPEGEPGGDDAILADLGTRPPDLRDLCVEEGLLPADVIYTLCERAGCAEVLEELRGA
jgi:putative tRNA adenosine deaminase-associated protein